MSEKMVKCGACQAEIAASAKTCPKCGAKNKKKRGCLQYGIGGVCLFIGIMWAISDGQKGAERADGGAPVQVKSAGSETSQPAKPAEIKVGDTITTPKLEMTVLAVEKRGRIASGFFESEPAEGGVYIAVQWEYKNISKQPINMWSQPTLRIKDPNGAQYDADVGASSTYATMVNITEKNVSDLNPGIKVKSAAVFEVAAEILKTPGWKISIDADRDIEFPFSIQ